MLNLAWHNLTAGLSDADREKFDSNFADSARSQLAGFLALGGNRRSLPTADAATGKRVPSWWAGDEEEALAARAVLAEHRDAPRGGR